MCYKVQQLRASNGLAITMKVRNLHPLIYYRSRAGWRFATDTLATVLVHWLQRLVLTYTAIIM